METGKLVGSGAFALAKSIIDILLCDKFARYHWLRAQSTLCYPVIDYPGLGFYKIVLDVGIHPPELSLEYHINGDANLVGVVDYTINPVRGQPRVFSNDKLRDEWIEAATVTQRKVLELLASEGFSETTEELNVRWESNHSEKPRNYVRAQNVKSK